MSPSISRGAIMAALCVALTSPATLTGCIADTDFHNHHTENEESLPVKFSTSKIATRAYDNLWEANDQIGVYMVSTGVSSWSTTTPLKENMLYSHTLEESTTTTEYTAFSGVDKQNTIMWPTGGEKVDFVAYYPYREEITNFIYPIDLSDQTSRAIDLMYADNVKNVNSGSPALLFKHCLAKLIFHVTDLDGVPLEDMKALIEGVPSSADFDLSKGEFVPPTPPENDPGNDPENAVAPDSFHARLTSIKVDEVDTTKKTAIVEAFIVPGDELSYTVTFTLTNGQTAVFPMENTEHKANKRYIYNVSLSSNSIEVDFGNSGSGLEDDLSSISDWDNVEEPEKIYKLEKNNKDDGNGDNGGGGGGEPAVMVKGEQWSSGTVENDPEKGYTITVISGTASQITDSPAGYQILNGEIEVQKSDYTDGIESITILASNSSWAASSKITSVTVGGVNFIYAGEEYAEIPSLSAPSDYEFVTPDGKLKSGDIEIVLSSPNNSKIILHSFTIN
jgi:hypothetical protein